MLNIIFVGLGGFCGAALRYLCGLLPIAAASRFPFITMAINILGALAIGFISQIAALRSGFSPQAVLFLKTGLCGGFTTFSTFSLESAGLLSGGRIGLSLLYMVGSVLLCLAAVFAGKALANFLYH